MLWGKNHPSVINPVFRSLSNNIILSSCARRNFRKKLSDEIVAVTRLLGTLDLRL